MSQEVIQDFLNLPGITGVALMDEHSHALFCKIDGMLDAQQKEKVVHNILCVVETIPEKFSFLEFKFSNHQVYLHKIDRGLTLLVLTDSNLVIKSYLPLVQALKVILQAQSDAISMLQHFAATVPPILAKQPPNQPEIDPVTAIADLGKPSLNAEVTLHTIVSALNQLSLFTSQYLGTQVIVNYWKSTRPADEWLTQFEVERTARFSLPNASSAQLSEPLSAAQQAQIQAWVTAFIQRCSQVIRNFSGTVQQNGLNDEQKSLLLGI
jgi:hypothetical protein